MIGWEALFHRPLSASEDLTSRLVDHAASFEWPVIFHADLRRYGMPCLCRGKGTGFVST